METAGWNARLGRCSLMTTPVIDDVNGAVLAGDWLAHQVHFAVELLYIDVVRFIDMWGSRCGVLSVHESTSTRTTTHC